MDEQLSVKLIEALAGIWSAIRKRHPDVPGVVLLPAPAQNGRMNVLGHFAPVRWSAKKANDAAFHEVVVVAEHLNRSAEAIAETLLHEAAHALDFNRGIRDCSKSQYHNQHFKAAAEQLGLVVKQVPHYGFALTSMPIETMHLYASEIRALDEVLVHRRAPRALPTTTKGGNGEEDDTSDTTPTGRSRKATCACPFIIRVATKTIRDTVILCTTCGEPFRIV